MKKILSFLGNQQLRLQGTFLWLLALINITTDSFWFFAVPAIIALGMQDILEEVRKLNQNDKHEIF
jgi:hypothetical protein